ncbi:hypothetical protein KM043_002777 [Ampulex compressa]|nr:hypothetical protein KM043_002777 [Ampulex compressa]
MIARAKGAADSPARKKAGTTRAVEGPPGRAKPKPKPKPKPSPSPSPYSRPAPTGSYGHPSSSRAGLTTLHGRQPFSNPVYPTGAFPRPVFLRTYAADHPGNLVSIHVHRRSTEALLFYGGPDHAAPSPTSLLPCLLWQRGCSMFYAYAVDRPGSFVWIRVE